MSSIISLMLFKAPTRPSAKGRVVRFGVEEPDILLSTGSMPERIVSYLVRNQAPGTAKEIASGIGSNASRVTRILMQLVKDGKVKIIKIDGCVTEYELM